MSKTGRKWRIYRNTGTYSTPVWSLVGENSDITLTLNKQKISAPRSGAEFMEMLKGYKTLTLGFDCWYENSNTNVTAFKDDFFNDNDDNFDLLVLDGLQATSGSEGMRVLCALFDFSIEAPLEDRTMVSLEFEPTAVQDGGSYVESDWHTVS
jgi:hypothetical protein